MSANLGFNTLLLDQTTWDFVVDSAGNIAMATPPYALAQDAASYIRLFNGEIWYDTTQGPPYFQKVLNRLPPVSVVKAYFLQQAMKVPGVTGARVFLTGLTSSRKLTGQVQIESVSGNTAAPF